MKEEKQLKMPRYYLGLTGKNPVQLSKALSDIDSRLEELEGKVLRTERKINTSTAQQLLLLKHLGILDRILELDILKRQKIELLSILLNSGADLVKKQVNSLAYKDSDLKTSHNYRFITKVFHNTGLKDIANETDLILDKLIKEENK